MRTSVVTRDEIGGLFDWLAAEGYTTVGPTVRDDAIVYDEIDSADSLPVGVGTVEGPGTHALIDRPDRALFGFPVPGDGWKRYLYPAHTELLRIRRSNGDFVVTEPESQERTFAFVGVRSCELAAIRILDRVFLQSGYVDRTYATNRDRLFVLAVNCADPGDTCFCASRGVGPAVGPGADVVLTELLDGSHRFVAEAVTPRGDRLVGHLGGRPATGTDRDEVAAVVRNSAARQTRSVPAGIESVLLEQHRSHRWAEIAQRCLTCGNCTMVCPTCFCSTTEDSVTLDGAEATRSRRWDSCFSTEFSALHGVPVRNSASSRYRQWMTHKLATWQQQFGSTGCVGCGRCITWCPVGIDITALARDFVAEEALK